MQLTNSSFLRSSLEPAYHRKVVGRQTAVCSVKLSDNDALKLSAPQRLSVTMSQMRPYLSKAQNAVPYSQTQSPATSQVKSTPFKIADPIIYYNSNSLGHKKKSIRKLASSDFTNQGKVSKGKTTFHSNIHFFNSGPGDGNPSMNALELGALLKARQPKETGHALDSEGPNLLNETGQGVITTISCKTETLLAYRASMQGANRLFRRPAM